MKATTGHWILITGYLLSAISLALATMSTDVNAITSVKEKCEPVEVVYARGSGQALTSPNEYKRFNVKLEEYIGIGKFHIYELGTESYGGARYPAVPVGDKNLGNTLGAIATGGAGFQYGDSVRKGVLELKSYLDLRFKECKTSYFILAGYSQGAQVVGESLFSLRAGDRQRVAFVGLFGDPKLNLPEGFGFFPPACRNNKDLSPYRRDIGSCDTDKGSLGARLPYLPNDFRAKTGLWCNAHDIVCGSSIWIWDADGHFKYADQGAAIDKAVREAAERLRPYIDSNYIATLSNPSAYPLRNSDRVYVVDPARLNQFELEDLKDDVLSLAQNTYYNGGRIALAESYEAGLNRNNYRILSKFNNGLTGFEEAITKIGTIDDSQTTSEAGVGQVLKAIMRETAWRASGPKIITYVTGASDIERDQEHIDYDTIIRSILNTAANEGGVIVSARTVGCTSGFVLEETVYYTSGEIYNDPPCEQYDFAPPSIVQSINQEPSWTEKYMQDQLARPTVAFDLETYYGQPGVPVHFEVEATLQSPIYGYQWDFDGDYRYDEFTETPYVEHTYEGNLEGYVTVRVVAENQRDAQASANVLIQPLRQYARPVSPSDLELTVLATERNMSSARLTWKVPSTLPAYYVLKLNGVILGQLTNDRTSIELRELDRTYDSEIAIMSVSSDGTMGKDTSVVLKAIKTTAASRGTAPEYQSQKNDTAGGKDAKIEVSKDQIGTRENKRGASADSLFLTILFSILSVITATTVAYMIYHHRGKSSTK